MSRAEGDAVSLRYEREEDAPAVAGVYIRAWQRGYRGLMPDDFLDGLTPRVNPRRGLPEQPGQPRSAVLAANGDIAGVTTFAPCRDKGAPAEYGEIITLYLLPEYWGLGLGRRMIDWVLGELRDMGFSHCVVWTLEANQRARRAYERAGFGLDEERKTLEFGGRSLEAVRYRREIP